jgi:hypothetical protein
VCRTEGGAQKPVAGLSHGFSATGLSGETVSALYVLVDLLSKILLHNGDLAELLLGIRVRLKLLQLVMQF